MSSFGCPCNSFYLRSGGHLSKEALDKLKGKPLVIKDKKKGSYTGNKVALKQSQCLAKNWQIVIKTVRF